MTKRDEYVQDELSLWRLHFGEEQGRPWASADIDYVGMGLHRATVSLFTSRGMRDATAITSFHAGTDYSDDSMSVSFHGSIHDPRVAATIEGFPEVNETTRQWMIDRINALPMVVKMMLDPAVEEASL